MRAIQFKLDCGTVCEMLKTFHWFYRQSTVSGRDCGKKCLEEEMDDHTELKILSGLPFQTESQ